MKSQPLKDNAEKVRITDPTRVLTLANIISLMRAMMAIPIIYTMQNKEWQLLTFFLIVLAVVSDALDGFFARRAHEVTHIGKWLDPIADFIVIITVTFYMVLFDRFPAWFFWLFMLRYVTISFAAIYLINHTHFILESNWFGKWAIGISSLTITLHIFVIPVLEIIKTVSLYAAALLLLISWGIYLITYLREIKNL